MIINITPHTTVRQVQLQFGKAFPFLKIEFADAPHEFMEASRKVHWYAKSFLVHTIAKKKVSAHISIQPWSKTGAVESEFQSKLGISAKIFRRQAYSWIQTAGTDMLSLDEQNEIGKRSIEKRSGSLWVERELLL